MKKTIILVLILLASCITISSTFAITSPILITDDFIWDGEDINVYYDKNLEKFVTDFIIEDYKNNTTDGVTYYVAKTGSDTLNDGLSAAEPFLTVKKALDAVDSETIYIDSGIYEYDAAFFTTNYTNKNVNMIGLDDDVFLTATDLAPSWIKTANYTNIYDYAAWNFGNILDSSVLDSNGGWIKYQLLGSKELVDALPGSYFYESNRVYVHPLDSRAADNYIHINSVLINGRFTSSNVYLENLKFYGGSVPLYIDQSTVYLNNVELKYAVTGNGLTAIASNVYIVDSEAAYNYADGFNYHNASHPENQYYMIEIDSLAHHNGINSVQDGNNGSTLHENYIGIRVNGLYHSNKGPNVVDIGTSKSMNYGTISRDSVATSQTIANVNFSVGFSSEDNKMWLVNTTSSGSDFDYDPITSRIHVLTYRTVQFVTNGGSAILDLFILDGTQVIYPPLTGKTGFTFSGWYYDSTLSNPFSFSNTSIEDDLILYARWTPQSGSYAVIGDIELNQLEIILIAAAFLVIGYILFTNKSKFLTGKR